jgi:hypothetical protein
MPLVFARNSQLNNVAVSVKLLLSYSLCVKLFLISLNLQSLLTRIINDKLSRITE